MNNLPLISIITPTLNSADNIEKCLLSVANQTYKNIEHLIVDGISSDATLDIIKNYQTQYANIKLISEKDRGIYDAMNKGIKLAKGTWLYFLGSDDRLFDRDVLKNIIDSLKHNTNCDVIYGNVYSTRFNGIYDGEFNASKILTKNICHQSVFFRKTVFNKTGYFNLKYKSHADWDHNMNWMLSPKINKKYINLIIAYYADGGYSSVNFDGVFYQERNLRYIFYGRAIFPLKYRIDFLKREIKRVYLGDDKKFLLKLFFTIPRIIISV